MKMSIGFIICKLGFSNLLFQFFGGSWVGMFGSRGVVSHKQRNSPSGFTLDRLIGLVIMRLYQVCG